MLEPRLSPPLYKNKDVVIETNVMGVITLGTLMEGNEVTTITPQMEKPDVLGMDGVGSMTLIDGKEDITEVPPMTLSDELEGSSILDETLTLEIM